MRETNVQRNYKDTVCRMLFKKKENLLSLYNALNKTAYLSFFITEQIPVPNGRY